MSESEVVATEFVVAATGKTKYMCELCKVSFAFRKNLNSHLKKFHQLQIELQGSQICVLCAQKFTRLSQLHEHLRSEHTIALNFVDETFYLEKDFLDWKNKIERETHSFYMLQSSSKNVNSGITFTYYNCHRSGRFKMKQNRIRKVKASGSIKTGSTCPAGIKVTTETVDGISEIKVKWQSVHLGHDLDSNVLRLTKEERENLAACLRLGISIDKILELARRNPSPTNPYKLLTRKHLHNIRTDFKIPINSEKNPIATLENAIVVASNISNGYKDSAETDGINPDKIQECEKNSAVSSLLQQNLPKVSVLPNANIEASDSSNGYMDCVETKGIDQEKIQECEKNLSVSSILQQNPPKVTVLANANVKSSDSISGSKDCLEIEAINHEEIQDCEKNSAISSLLQQNPLNYPPKTSAFPNANFKVSDSSCGYEDSLKIAGINHEETQDCEKNSAVSSILEQNSEQFNTRKMEIFNQLKELHSRIEKWDPQCPLPVVEEHIKSVNVWLDNCASSYRRERRKSALAKKNKPKIKQSKTKSNSKKSTLN